LLLVSNYYLLIRINSQQEAFDDSIAEQVSGASAKEQDAVTTGAETKHSEIEKELC